MSRNPFNLWNPGPDSEVLDVAFSAYAKHKQECDDIVQRVLEGETSFDLDDDFDESDLRYINERLQKHGVDANFDLW